MSAISSRKFCIIWKCSASFHAVHECFSKKNMSRLNMHFFKRWSNYDWIWTFSRHHLHFALKALPCWKKTAHLQGINTLCTWKRNWNLRNVLPEKIAVSWIFFFEKIMYLENNSAFCSELCTVPLWKCKNTSTCLKDLLHALHKLLPPFKGDNGL